MDLLKTILLYMSLVFATSVQNAPEPSYIPVQPTAAVAAVTPTPTPRPTPVPTINITPNPAYKAIQMGDNGDQVRQLQEKLMEYGYYTGELDGRFGNQTRRAVEAFQYQHGLSADGIAGRNTLTVLYESPEIRRSPDAEATPSPTPETQLSVAMTAAPQTAEPTAEPTAAPAATPAVKPEASPTFAPVQTVEAVATAVPSATPVPELEAMPDYVISLEENGDPVLSASAAILRPALVGEELYLPLADILRAAGMNIIATTSIETDEFAFAMGSDLIRISYTEDQDGHPVDVEVYKNLEPQIMPVRDIRRLDDAIYLPAESIKALTGIEAEVDGENGAVIVHMPVE